MPQLSNFKALLFDIDRTLIPKSREIYPEVIEMFNNLDQAGFVIGLCSGRGFASIQKKFAPLFPENSAHVLAGGSLVVSNTGTVLWEQTIDSGSTEYLKNLVMTTDEIGIFMKPDAQYSHGEVLEGILNHPWNQIGKDLSAMSTDGVGLIYIPNPSDETLEYVKNNPKLAYKDMISSSGHRYFDITAAGVTKAKALKEWSAINKIPTEQIIGFGDSVNDLEFLQTVGFSVAMGNAEEEIKNIANKVIGSVDEKGLPNYIQSILESKEL
jgi:hypothetical protein